MTSFKNNALAKGDPLQDTTAYAPDSVFSIRQTKVAICEKLRLPQPFPVFQTGSTCESLGDSNQRVMVIFCWV
jgi:hypothetical protein